MGADETLSSTREHVLHALEAGACDRVVVLLHGFGSTSNDWRRVMAESHAGHRLIAYDLPGHGGSLDFPQADVPKLAARAVLADLAARGIASAHFVGHSMGGAIASLCALFDPARVASLLLLAPGGFGPQINHRLLKRYARASEETELRLCLENMYGWFSDLPDDALEDALAMRRDPRQRAMLIEIAAALAPSGHQGVLPLDAVASLPMPKRVVWGELDNVLPVGQARSLPHGFRVRVEHGLGHMLPREAPALVALLVKAGDCA